MKYNTELIKIKNKGLEDYDDRKFKNEWIRTLCMVILFTLLSFLGLYLVTKIQFTKERNKFIKIWCPRH